MEIEQSIEYQAGATLVHDGIKFDIEKVFGKKKTICIKPQLPGSVVRISQKVLRLKPINDGTIEEFMEKGENVEIIAGIIATAIINQDIYKRWKYCWYKWLMLNRVKDMEYLFKYFLIVQRQMGPLFFYRIMDLTPAMNYLKKQEERSREGKPSGEPSH